MVQEIAIIPAAGMGTRMYPISKIIPKELLPLGTKPAIHCVLDEIESSNIEDIIVITSPEKVMIKEYIENVFLEHKNVNIIFIEQKQPLGLGNALHLTKEHIKGKISYLLLPDNIFFGKETSINQMRKAYQKEQSPVVGLYNKDMHPRGKSTNWELEKITDEIFRIESFKNSSEHSLTNVGRVLFTPECVNYLSNEIKKSEIPILMNYKKTDGEVFGISLHGSLFDVGIEDGYLAASSYLYGREY